MLNTFQSEKIRQGAQWTIIALFMGLLWLPTLDSFFHLDKSPMPDENRLPAKFPIFNHRLDGMRGFVAGLESYYNDHFGFRKRLIRWNNRWKRELFRESSVPSVLTGRNGWLYYSGEGMANNYLGLTPFSDHDLRDWKSLLETRRDWLARRGIGYLFVIAPNKESVYPEFLPAWMVKTGPTKLDQFVDYMKTNSTVAVLDLRPVLREAKKTRRVYLMNDTHWNFEGGFITHQEIVRALARQIPIGEPLSATLFRRVVSWQKGGDLAHMLGQDTNAWEDAPLMVPIPPLTTLDLVPAPQLLASNKWNPDTVPVLTENPNRKGTAMVFRDSFAGCWAPYLCYYFGKVIYVWEATFESGLIEKEHPLVVIDESVERFFYSRDPAKLKITDNLK